MPPVFPLQPLLDLSQMRLDQAARELGELIAGEQEATKRLALLLQYDFPGNIRELQNIIEYAFILCSGGLILPEHLPSPLAGQLDPVLGGMDLSSPLPLVQIEKRAIFIALKRNGGRRMVTCRELGISKDTLRRKISQFSLEVQGELAEV